MYPNSITSIQHRNRNMIQHQKYCDMQHFDPQAANHWYHLLPTDSTSLYRKFSRKNGVDVHQKPKYNINEWLDPTSPSYNKSIHEAIFHYSAWSNAQEWFKVCISTWDMDEAAWKYVHQSQLILDGTFGVCTSCLLLFIALSVNEDWKGVPVAFFLFSAPTGNQATHAGYNTSILRKLLAQWKQHIGKQHDESFTPYVAITDTDTKEHSTFSTVWPGIILLLCKFHLHQCWRNHQKTALRCAGAEFWKNHVQDSLGCLEIQYVNQI